MTCIVSKILEWVSWHLKENISLCILFLDKEFKIQFLFICIKEVRIGNRFSEQ